MRIRIRPFHCYADADPDPAFSLLCGSGSSFQNVLTHSLARVIQMLEVFLGNLGGRLAERTLEPSRDFKENVEKHEITTVNEKTTSER